MVSIPDDIAADEALGGVWAELCPEGNRFTEQDVPTLRLLVFWHGVAMEAQRQMSRSGRLAIFDPVAVKPFADASGRQQLMVRKSPALTVLKEATSEIRALSDALGITPAARSRMGAEEGRGRADTEKARLLASALSEGGDEG